MKNTILLGMVFLLSLQSCQEGINIKRLEHRELTFQQLPKTIQEVLKDPSDFKEEEDWNMSIKSLIVINSINKYSESIINYPFGPKSWIKGMLLTDISTNKKYQIDREDNPHPYIIYSGKLYIPKEYNIFTGDTWYTSKYTEYILK